MIRIVMNAISGGSFIVFGICWIIGRETVRENWWIASVLMPILIFTTAMEHILKAVKIYINRKFDLEFERLAKKKNDNP